MLTLPGRTPVAPIPPIGVGTGPLVGGGFLNPSAHAVAHINLLPPMPANGPTSLNSIHQNGMAGQIALGFQTQNQVTAPSAPVDNSNPAPGSLGSTGLAGSPVMMAVAGEGGVAPVAVGPISMFQLSNPTLDVVGRLGLPIAGYLLWRAGHHALGGVALAGAAALWANRLTRINL